MSLLADNPLREKMRPRLLLGGVLSLVLLVLSGCGLSERALAGVWRGRAGGGDYTFEFRPGGEARVSVKAERVYEDFPCSWTLSVDRIRLTRDHGETVSFRIIDQSSDELALRVNTGRDGICRLRRVAVY